MKMLMCGAMLATLGAGCVFADAALEEGVSLKVPSDAGVKSVEVYLDVAGAAAREEQVGEESDAMLSIGRVGETIVDAEGGKVERKKKLVEQPVMFYLFSPTSHVQDFELSVVGAKTSEGFVTEGETPAQFQVEVVQLRGVGEVRGKVLKTIDGVAFKIGEGNRFPLDLEVAAGTTVGVRVSLDRSVKEEASIQVKASKKGKYPANVLRWDGDGELVAGEGLYHPAVSFGYRGAPETGKLRLGNPLERLAEQINNYVKGQSGKGSEVQVPLRVRVQTGP